MLREWIGASGKAREGALVGAKATERNAARRVETLAQRRE